MEAGLIASGAIATLSGVTLIFRLVNTRTNKDVGELQIDPSQAEPQTIQSFISADTLNKVAIGLVFVISTGLTIMQLPVGEPTQIALSSPNLRI